MIENIITQNINKTSKHGRRQLKKCSCVRKKNNIPTLVDKTLTQLRNKNGSQQHKQSNPNNINKKNNSST